MVSFPVWTDFCVKNFWSFYTAELTALVNGSHAIALPESCAFVFSLFLILYYGTRTMHKPSATCCLKRNSIPTTDQSAKKTERVTSLTKKAFHFKAYSTIQFSWQMHRWGFLNYAVFSKGWPTHIVRRTGKREAIPWKLQIQRASGCSTANELPPG